MRLFKFLWTTHKWTGILLGIVYLNIAVTGFLLLVKKDYDWIQPPTREGASGGLEKFLSLQEVFDRVFARGHADFKSLADVDRVDFRPAKRVHKVRSKHNHTEIQVCAVTGEILSLDWRPSDMIEQIHDGSFFGSGVHGWLMPVVACLLAFMVFSGLYIWLWPVLLKRHRRANLAKRSQKLAESKMKGY